ncbi:MAG TPA: C4-dicarboxylate ABC transporter permease, partial [Parvularcula sp.]|nr:C4-dicarboxylate ABC transporter permease [Parvularcula sp.]
VETLVRGAGRISQIIVLAMAAIQFAAVILRYVFGLNFIAMQESVTYLHGAVFLLAGGYALLTDDHVRVDIFYREASPRRKALIDLAGTYLLLLPFCLVALWAAAPYVANSWAVREGSVEQSGIRGVYLLKTLIPLYLTLLLLAGFSAAARAAETLRPSKG